VCGLYLNPPENVVVWSVDDKPGMQAKSRVNPTKPAVPGIPARREFEYRRHGTAVLFAALDVHPTQGRVSHNDLRARALVRRERFVSDASARFPS